MATTYNVYEYNEFFIISVVNPGNPETFITQLFASPHKAVKAIVNGTINPRYKPVLVGQIGKQVLSFTHFK